MKVFFIVFSMAFAIASMEGSVVKQRDSSGLGSEEDSDEDFTSEDISEEDSDDDRQQERVIFGTFMAKAAAAKAAKAKAAAEANMLKITQILMSALDCAKNIDVNECLATAAAEIAKITAAAAEEANDRRYEVTQNDRTQKLCFDSEELLDAVAAAEAEATVVWKYGQL